MRDNLAAIVEFEFLEKVVDAGNFERLIQLIATNLPGKQHLPTIEESLRHLVGGKMDAITIGKTCHRLAGNLPRLKRRRPVLPWRYQIYPEWVPMQILSARRERNHRGQPGGMLAFKIVAGTSCSLVIRRWWSNKRCRFLSQKFRFSKPPSRKSREVAHYPYSVVEQLVGLRFCGLMEAELSDDEPGFFHIKFTPSINEWNREQLRIRFRVDPDYNCPENYPSSFPCYRCSLGRESCLGATHARDYVQRFCKKCQQDAPFDPDQDSALCVNCHYASLRGSN